MHPTKEALPGFIERKDMFGPVIRKLQLRALRLWLLVSVCGMLLAITHATSLTALGLGFVLPGAGLLYGGHPLLTVLTWLLFVAGMALWLLIGAFIAPIIVWAGAAVIAMLLTRSGVTWNWALWAVPLVAAALVLRSVTRHAFGREKRLQATQTLNAQIRSQHLPPPNTSWTLGPALDAQEIGAMRFMLDLALQPLDRWDGFTSKDQFREAAYRYQLYAIVSALSSLRATRMPAFRGYVQQAQFNACLKMTERKVWDYWFWENLWGNFRIDADPMKHDNIMLSGYYAVALGTYQITTGDLAFDQPGSLPFRLNEAKLYPYDYPRIAQSLLDNFRRSELMLFPCEPNWVFAFCNSEGMAGLALYDRIHGTAYSREILPTFCRRMDEEMVTGDGRPVSILASRVGMPILGDTAQNISAGGWLRSVYDRKAARRDWSQLRLEGLPPQVRADFKAKGAARIDPGDYTLSDGNAFFPFVMQGAREMGDDEIYGWAKARHDALGPVMKNGALHWPGSTFSNLNAHMARFGDEDLWYRFGNVPYPKEWLTGPMLETAAYPDVIVAHAASTGEALHLVLEPGAGAKTVDLTFSQLLASRQYLLDGAHGTFMTDPDGQGAFAMHLAGRISLTIHPA